MLATMVIHASCRRFSNAITILARLSSVSISEILSVKLSALILIEPCELFIKGCK